MFDKIKKIKHKKLLLSLIVLFLLPVSLFTYNQYEYGEFKRVYEHGTTYDQLNTLMGTTKFFGAKRYVKDIRKAGYFIDDYNLKMNDYITILETKNLKMSVLASTSYITVSFKYHFKNNYISVYQYLRKDMKPYGSGIYRKLDESGKEIEEIKLSPKEEDEIAEIAKKEIDSMLEDIYKSMYPDEK